MSNQNKIVSLESRRQANSQAKVKSEPQTHEGHAAIYLFPKSLTAQDSREARSARRAENRDVAKSAGKIGLKVAGVAALSFGIAAMAGKFSGEHKVTKEIAPICVPSKETHQFTFDKKNDTENEAIFDIQGAGEGEGAVCFDAAKEIVDEQLHGQLPQPNQTITIPDSIHPLETPKR